MARFDISELKEFQKQLETMGKNTFDNIAEQCTNELAARMLRKTKKRTPVKSGHLKGSWRANAAIKRGGQWRTAVFNPVKYAPYVEYGHKQQPGRYVKAIGKRLVKSWVEGKHMMERSADDIERDAEKIIQSKMRKILSEELSK